MLPTQHRRLQSQAWLEDLTMAAARRRSPEQRDEDSPSRGSRSCRRFERVRALGKVAMPRRSAGSGRLGVVRRCR